MRRRVEATAFATSMFVLASDQTCGERRVVQILLERTLARVDPADDWRPEEAWKRAHGERN